MAKDKDQARADHEQTERVVLRKCWGRWTTERDEEGAETFFEAWAPIVDTEGGIIVFKGTKRQAIDEARRRTYGANENDETHKFGEYRAPALSSWTGVRKFVPPPPDPLALWEEG
jgi:hypothetical protein